MKRKHKQFSKSVEMNVIILRHGALLGSDLI